MLRRSRIFFRDASNIARYGGAAPHFAQRIWLDPRDVRHFLLTGFNRFSSGQVVDGDWDDPGNLRPIERFQKIDICLKRWSLGRNWEEAGAYDLMHLLIAQRGGAVDGCRTHNDIVERYERLDRIFAQVSAERRLKTVRELDPEQPGEWGGVYIHLGRGGAPVFGCGGAHRLAMALALGLDRIPAQLGVVHPGGLASLKEYSRPG